MSLPHSDLTLLETASEFVTRFRHRKPRVWAPPETSIAHSSDQRRYPERPGQPLSGPGSLVQPLEAYTALPMLSSTCPGIQS